MKHHISLFICFIFSLNSHATETKFYNINSTYGISMRKVTSVCKDNNGFIWGASKMGILRISDGDCKIYQLPYTATDILSVKLAYGHSGLYACTSNGQLFLYDKIYDEFILIKNLRQLLNSKYFNVHKIMVDNDGVLWLTSSRGLYHYKNDSLTLVGGEAETVQIVRQHDDRHLFYDTGIGIKRIHTTTLRWEYIYKYQQERELQVSALFYDHRLDRLWMGTSFNGLCYLEKEGDEYKRRTVSNFPKQPILAIEENSDSTLLIGIDGKGIWEINKTGDSVLNVYKENIDNPSSLRGDGVYDILCDDKNRIWVATYSGGLSFFEQPHASIDQITHQINNANSLGNNNVNKILEDRNGYLWFATNNGVSRWNRESDKWDIYYQDKKNEAQTFLALCEDNEGNIWVGSYSSGVYVLDGKTGKEKRRFYPEDAHSGFSCKFVFDIFKDSQGDIWIGGIQGNVLCYLVKDQRFRSYPNQPVYSFRELVPGKILAACSHGLILFDKESGGIETLLSGFVIQDCVIIEGDFWIATNGEGLVRYNLSTRETEKFTTESGILSNFINSIVYFEDHLLLGTEYGLCKFNIENRTVHSYPSVLALSSISYNSKSYCWLKNGELAWGTSEGAMFFDPGMPCDIRLNGRIFFQDINVSGRSIREIPDLIKAPVNEQENLHFNYTQNSITVELLSIGISIVEVSTCFGHDD